MYRLNFQSSGNTEDREQVKLKETIIKFRIYNLIKQLFCQYDEKKSGGGLAQFLYEKRDQSRSGCK